METFLSLALKEWMMAAGLVVFLIGLVMAWAAWKKGNDIPGEAVFVCLCGLGAFLYGAFAL